MHNRPIVICHCRYDAAFRTCCHVRVISACVSRAIVLARHCSLREGRCLLGLASGLVGGVAEALARGGAGEEAAEDGLEEGAEDDLGAPVEERLVSVLIISTGVQEGETYWVCGRAMYMMKTNLKV